ncbi:hypothetical protein J2Z80_002765, partial [Thermoanaerobacterium butyriciformans]|nr:hypothetical protein [Thermoanaerobacterium butyriciformans]
NSIDIHEGFFEDRENLRMSEILKENQKL